MQDICSLQSVNVLSLIFFLVRTKVTKSSPQSSQSKPRPVLTSASCVSKCQVSSNLIITQRPQVDRLSKPLCNHWINVCRCSSPYCPNSSHDLQLKETFMRLSNIAQTRQTSWTASVQPSKQNKYFFYFSPSSFRTKIAVQLDNSNEQRVKSTAFQRPQLLRPTLTKSATPQVGS